MSNTDLARLEREGVRVRVIGRRDGLSPDILEVIERAEARTAPQRPASTCRSPSTTAAGPTSSTPRAGSPQDVAGRPRRRRRRSTRPRSRRYLSTAEAPPPDLIVRTSGRARLSNFLLWEAAYAEFVFQDVLWPDYGPEHLKAAIDEFESARAALRRSRGR